MTKDEKLLIKTPIGTLVAYPSNGDDDRPGIFIDLRRPGFGVDAPLALIECDATGDKPELTTRVWGDVNCEGNVDCITHGGIGAFFTLCEENGEETEYPPDGEQA